MKSSLVFMGAVLVAFATGALLTTAIEVNVGTTVSHPTLFSRGDRLGVDTPAETPPVSGSVANWVFSSAVAGVFLPNLGQVRHDVYFQFMSNDELAFMRATSIGIAWRAAKPSGRILLAGVNARFIGANPRPALSATGRFDTHEASSSETVLGGLTRSAPLFSEVTYSELYDGVDLTLSAAGPRVARRFTLAGGTDPATVLLYYDGADRPVVLPSGALSVATAEAVRVYPRPRASQYVNGVVKTLTANYALRRFGSFGFSVAGYDPSLPLVIEVEGM